MDVIKDFDAFMNGESKKLKLTKRVIIRNGKSLFSYEDVSFGSQIQNCIAKAHDAMADRITNILVDIKDLHGSEASEKTRVRKKPVKVVLRDGKHDDLVCAVTIKATMRYFMDVGV